MAGQGHLRDTCLIGTQAAPVAPEPVGAWTYSATEIRCRFAQTSGRLGYQAEVPIATGQELTDGTIRLPAGTTVTAGNRLKVTKKNYTTLATAQEYEIVGEPQSVRTAGIVCNVRRIAGNSVR